jgi:hypothetical protein
MNTTFVRSLALALLVTGCTQTVGVKPVNAATGQPVPGVTGTWRQDVADLLLGVRHRGPKDLPEAALDGTISLRGVHKHWISSFVLRRPGFTTEYGVYAGGSLAFAERTNSASWPWKPVVLAEPIERPLPTNGVFVVLMRPL